MRGMRSLTPQEILDFHLIVYMRLPPGMRRGALPAEMRLVMTTEHNDTVFQGRVLFTRKAMSIF